MPWISRRELLEIKDRIRELEYATDMYVGVGEKFPVKKIVSKIIDHLEIDFYKPSCEIKIVKKGGPEKPE